MPRSAVKKQSPALRGALVVLGLTLVGQVACSQVRYTEAFMPEGDVQRVVVRSDAGQVEVVTATVLRVERDIRAPEAALALTHELQADGTLLIEARCRRLLPCAVDTRVEVPAGMPVEIDVGTGDIWATGVASLALDLGEGTADVDLHGPLTASIGSGSLTARLAVGADARVGIGSGDIQIEVPEGPWRIDADAERLQLQGIASDPDAEAVGGGHLELVAPSGVVTVRSGEGLARR
ncbi:MAG: hypothetical protein H6742_05835 [Alphaproteobacteria bacterium]|nr:hypothetical protein [Alphaproteobacteria bacterium]